MRIQVFTVKLDALDQAHDMAENPTNRSRSPASACSERCSLVHSGRPAVFHFLNGVPECSNRHPFPACHCRFTMFLQTVEGGI